MLTQTQLNANLTTIQNELDFRKRSHPDTSPVKFPPLYPLYFPVHGAQYVAPPGGITLKIKELSAWIDDFSIQNFLTGDVLFNAKHSTWTKTTKFNNPQGNRICKFSGTSFNVNRPVEDANHKRLYKVSSSGLMIERKLWTVVTFDGQLRTVQMEATYGDANIYVVIGGQKQLVAVNNCNAMPSISSPTVLTNMRFRKFRCETVNPADLVSISSEQTEVPDPSLQEYLRRIAEEQKRTQPQVFTYGHQTLGSRGVL
ncbi:hypothetical protein BJ742DRAFT_740253 [Cladochytrium replicatum]|nr:hypothetical protein BJ742DRAFT_740253 [Cladochytrium replicatum]